MKKPFKREGRFLFDEALNTGFDEGCFLNEKERKLSKKVRDKCLTDLGTNSDTEYHSARILYENQIDSPAFLEWMLKMCRGSLRKHLLSSLLTHAHLIGSKLFP